jgi:beta-glucanase (GH16 family)
MGVRPFGDPRIADDFSAVQVPVDARDFHVYAAEWAPGQVLFFVDGELVKTVGQAPDYEMQLMLSIYEFPGESDAGYPKEFVVDYVRGYRLSPTVDFPAARSSHR